MSDLLSDTQTPAPDASTAGTSGNVTVLELPDKTVHLVGTAHISSRSAEEVREVIGTLKPDAVCVELDAMRLKALTRNEAWRDMDLFQVVRNRQSTMLLAHLILSSFQRKLGEQLGVKPGAEMLAAVQAAENQGAELVLADRDIQVTLRRTWGRLRFWDKLKLLTELLGTLVISPNISEEEIEQLKEKDMLGQVMETFAKAFPRAKTVLIDERDAWLAEKIRTSPGKTVVAVVGAGHVPGIVRHLAPGAEPTDLAPLGTLPGRGWGLRAVQWGIPLLVLGLLGYGFATAEAHVSWGMVRVWVLANGILAALGALLAMAHPVTVATAFVAAPITSLNPMVAAGWVAGLCELLLRKPRVRDFESLPKDITSVRGFWRNGITRVLLVVALANVGSSIGTFVGIPLMTRLLG